ncbi:GNAT family N-acetyltransferase [Xylanimonas oleitrophica]|uniref:GNAT family N-acetyltransferase n=1 Tax=Xylanimonas oleitrophica TaxID=2607479 RepID=A0A2W5WV59_9MICO|nr:GNAT family N-acetyltransferase [Xylanimonas oleitrophica]PZR52156.1 GNAT family N-acetyltransferase [Xylanimonas oleitrophica]
MNVEVSPPVPAEHALLVAVWRRAVEATHHFLSPADVDWYEERVAAHLDQADDVLVARAPDGTPLGFAGGSDGRIDMLFVDPEVHGQGVGTRLLEALAAGHEEVHVDVNEGNESGRRFYAAKGFVQVGRSALDDDGRPFPILHLRRG